MVTRTLWLACGSLILVLVAGSMREAAFAQGGVRETEVERLIQKLDADEFSVRRQAQQELRKLGEAAIPALKQALRSTSPEVGRTAAAILRDLREGPLREGFSKLAKLAEEDDAKLDLEEGMLLIAELVEGDIDRAAVKKQLDDYAAAVRAKLGDIEPAKADPQRVVEAVREVLFKQAGFDGAARTQDPFDDAEDLNEVYDDPRHSSLPHVLKTKRGLPITLSHVVVCVGDRLDVPLVGLGLPGRYMVKYDGNRAPKGFPPDDIILDPYEGGRVASKDDLVRLLGARDIESYIRPSPRRTSLVRMLTNVVSHLNATQDLDRMAQATMIRQMFVPPETETEPLEDPGFELPVLPVYRDPSD